MSRALVYLLFFFTFHLEAKHQLSICSLFRNESKNLREWIEYHRLIGVDHFYLYENGSTDRYMKVLKPYINQKIVTIVPWPNRVAKVEGEDLFKWSLSTQVIAYENAIIAYGKKETDWLVFLDVDEFLVPIGDETLKDLLKENNKAAGISVRSDHFDAARLGPINLDHLVIEATEITKAPDIDLRESVAKLIFKPLEYDSFQWPPYKCIFKGNQKPIEIDHKKLRINQYLNRNSKAISPRRKYQLDNRKVSRSEVEEVLNAGYDIEDHERAIHRFVPELMKKLSLQPNQ